jgi:uncharacterized protein YjbI with pentapeptide repeats
MFEKIASSLAAIWAYAMPSWSFVSGIVSALYDWWSTQILIVVIAIIIILALVGYFWAWHKIPQAQVPIHLSPNELKVLEVQDQLRKTQIQIPFVIAIVATFILVVIQLGVSSRQWSSDFQLRTGQMQLGQFSDAIQSLTSSEPERRVAGVYALEYLIGLDPAKYIRRVDEILATSVRSRTGVELLRVSVECNGQGHDRPKHREEPPEDVQAALNVLGNKSYSNYFAENYDSRERKCVWRSEGGAKETHVANRPNFTHRYLDNVKMSSSNLVCGKFSASFLRRASFEWSDARGADFSAAVFEGEGTGLKVALTNAEKEHADRKEPFHAASWIHTTNYNQWKRYRCWSAYFANATLDGANFQDAHLAGAVFQNASLKDSNFQNANISLADFRDTKRYGLSKNQLKAGCIENAESRPLHDFEEDLEFKLCPPEFLAVVK